MSHSVGLLFSQIGYDANSPKRILFRAPIDRDDAPIPWNWVGQDTSPSAEKSPLQCWGSLWGQKWWVAELTSLPDAKMHRLLISQAAGLSDASAEFSVEPDCLWNSTWRSVSYEQGERRARLAMNHIGWQDCGAAWQEANSHAAYVLGFLDLLEFKAAAMTEDERRRVEAQIRCGLDYLVLLQDRAGERGFADGAILHQTPTLEEVLAGDTIKAAVCWARASRLLSSSHVDAKKDYAQRAIRAFAWFRNEATPSNGNFSNINHGAPHGYMPPTGVWRTSDLCMALWAAFSLWETTDDTAYKAECEAIAALILPRQIAAEESEGGFYGHFRTFPVSPFTEKAWTHHIDNKVMGGDAGGHFPHWILPLIRMADAWPEHTQAEKWRDSVQNFAEGYFKPACHANPFLILPLGYFTGEGLLWFAGSWHGMTAIYALAAVLAQEFGRFLGDADGDYLAIATGNLQWIAGLNSGITAESQFASHLFRCDVPEGVALPVSLILGIGRASAGSWLNVRGSICNGFSAGQQFRFDVPATCENDAPSAFTDEDWISHAGAWLSGIARLE